MSQRTQREKPKVPEFVHEHVLTNEGEMTVRTYARGKFLGKGGFARCYELTCSETGKIYAGKVVAKASLIKPRAKQKFKSEIKIHKSLNHHRVVGFCHYFEDDLNAYILLELCKNYTLAELMRKRKRLTEKESVYFMNHILEGVHYCHSRNIIHRDLKLGNLFLSSDMQIKLGDFGLATRVDHKDQRRQTMCGTPNYIAPEILKNHGAGHSFEVDIWSIGVILYTMLFGRPPYEASDVKTTYQLIKENKYGFPEHVEISNHAKDLIRCILQTSPDVRPSLKQIRMHPFFTAAGPIPESLPSSIIFSSPKKSQEVKAKPTIVRKPLQARDVNVNHESAPVAEKEKVNKPHRSPQSTSPGKQRLEATYLTLRRSLAQADQPEALSAALSNLHIGSMPVVLSDYLWVVQHIDYSNKYGMGYLISDGSCGVYFNDATKIIQASDLVNFDYINRSSVRNGPAQNIRTHHQRSAYDESLKKKVVLMEHFRDYLHGMNQDADPEAQPFVAKLRDTKNSKQNNGLVYIRKWIKSEQAVVFQFSSGVFQVSFNDKTQLRISENGKTVTCVNPAGQVEEMSIAAACSRSRPNLAKRIKYTAEVLNQMIKLRNTSTTPKK